MSPLSASAAKDVIVVIQRIWADILGADAIGPNDDFFELGGHSLLVASAVAQLNERLGIELPLRALFEAPTPAELAELIAELRAASPSDRAQGMTPFIPDWIIPLQRAGESQPIFVFPAGHHEMRALAIDAQIAAHVGREHPFWGFRREALALAAAREGGAQGLAAVYIRQMRAMQGKGPYLLCGNCAGGYLAWEVAGQLLAAGEGVSGLFFFEVPLRPDFDRLMPGFTPPDITREWYLSLYYRPLPLPVAVTHLMTDGWAARGSGEPWQQVVRGPYETIVIPVDTIGTRQFLARREEIIAGYLREWIDQHAG